MRWNAQFSLRLLVSIVTFACLLLALFISPSTYVIRHDTSKWSQRVVTQVGNPISIWTYPDEDENGERIGDKRIIIKDAEVSKIELKPNRIDEIEIRVNLYQKFKLSLYRNKFWIDTEWTRGNSVWHPSDKTKS